jgi:LacI family transcriptional regulator
MKKRPTLADVARSAGVSLMTVSRAINNKAGVSADVRKSILKLAKELGYHPNQIARGLATNYTTSVGLVVPDNTNPFFAQIARGVEDTAYDHGYNIFLVNTAEDATREESALNSLCQKGVDGLILISSRLPVKALKEEVALYPAVVLVNRELKPIPANTITVNINDQHGSQLAIRHFLASGRQRISYVNGPANSLSAKRRLEGYKKALEEAGLAFEPDLVERSAPDTDGGGYATTTLLKRRPDIDAIYAFNDLVAVGAMQTIEQLGKRIPEDIAVIGFDDIPLASIIRPQLTTLHVDLRQIGHLAMQTLLDKIAGNSRATSIQIEPQLVLRASTWS